MIASAHELALTNFFGLVRHELAEPLRRAAELAERLEPLCAASHLPVELSGALDFAEFSRTAAQSAAMTDRLLSMADLLATARIQGDERVLLPALLREVAATVLDIARDRRVGISLECQSQVLGPVYGSTRWLRRALRDLLASLLRRAPAGAHVRMHLRQVGCHQVLSAVVAHRAGSAAAVNLLAGAPAAALHDEIASVGSVAELDRALARAIVELHGGMLKLGGVDSGDDQFTVSLPTGEGEAHRQSHCADCPYVRQSELFARDLAELLNQPAVPAAIQP